MRLEPEVPLETSLSNVRRRPTLRLGSSGGAFIALIALVLVLSFTQPFFLGKANILNVLSTTTPLFLVALGMTFVVITAGFDLSVGAVVAATGVAIYFVQQSGAPIWLVILAGLIPGLFIGGVVNGSLIGRLKMNFFVVTLGTMTLFGGLVNVVTNGQTFILEPDGLVTVIGSQTLLGISIPIWIAAVAFGAALLVLRFTPFGRAVYAVGGNREAARLSGINVTGTIVLVYAISGFTAALAGFVVAGRLAAASPSVGSQLALSAGAAVLLGGTSFFGGTGGVGGTLIGVLLIAVLQNGLGLYGVSAFWQGVVTGAVLLAALFIDRLQSRAGT